MYGVVGVDATGLAAWRWALRGHSGLGHSNKTVGLGTPRDFGAGQAGDPLQVLARDTVELGTPGTAGTGTLGGWALQG